MCPLGIYIRSSLVSTRLPSTLTTCDVWSIHRWLHLHLVHVDIVWFWYWNRWRTIRPAWIPRWLLYHDRLACLVRECVSKWYLQSRVPRSRMWSSSHQWTDAQAYLPTYARDNTTICPDRGEHHAPLVGGLAFLSVVRITFSPHHIPATSTMHIINIDPILTYEHSLRPCWRDGCIWSSCVDFDWIFVEIGVRIRRLRVGVRRWVLCASFFWFSSLSHNIFSWFFPYSHQ